MHTYGLQNDYENLCSQIDSSSIASESDHPLGSRHLACISCGQDVVGNLGSIHWLTIDLTRNSEKALEALNQAVGRIVIEVHSGMDIDGQSDVVQGAQNLGKQSVDCRKLYPTNEHSQSRARCGSCHSRNWLSEGSTLGTRSKRPVGHPERNREPEQRPVRPQFQGLH